MKRPNFNTTIMNFPGIDDQFVVVNRLNVNAFLIHQTKYVITTPDVMSMFAAKNKHYIVTSPDKLNLTHDYGGTGFEIDVLHSLPYHVSSCTVHERDNVGRFIGKLLLGFQSTDDFMLFKLAYMSPIK